MGMMGQQMRIGPQMGMGHQVSSSSQFSGSESGSTGSTCLLRFHANRDRYQYIIIFQPGNICVFYLNRYGAGTYCRSTYIAYTGTRFRTLGIWYLIIPFVDKSFFAYFANVKNNLMCISGG
jgi:hypothetical protein